MDSYTSWILFASTDLFDSDSRPFSLEISSLLRASSSPYWSVTDLAWAISRSRSDISASREMALLRELDLLPRLASHLSVAASLAAGIDSPPGTVRNLVLIPPSVRTFSSSRSLEVMANTLLNSCGSSVPVGRMGLSPSTDFCTSLTVLVSPSCS